MGKYVIGIDFGTLSARALIADALSGEEIAESVFEYPHAVMDKELWDGTPLQPQSALQHPADYLLALKKTVADALEKSGLSACDIKGVCIDFTGCTMLPVDKYMQPLCFNPEFEHEPNAYVKLWKSHSAEEQANRITAVAERRGEKWLKIYSGKISSEWLLPKVLQTLEQAPNVYYSAERFIEAGDWLTSLLTGNETHACSYAGLKALWNDEDGYPSNDFFKAVDGRLDGIVGTKISDSVTPAGTTVGYIGSLGESLTGLKRGTAVASSLLDAHAAMPALGITEEGEMMMILGTSGCYIVNRRQKLPVKGICGYAADAIYPGYYTYEAGQSCLGDGYEWFVKNFVPEKYTSEAWREGKSIHKYLREKAQSIKPGENTVLALDWFNGNRSVLADYDLSGMILGLTLATRPEEIYRAIIEASAFGARMIIDTYADGGIQTDKLYASGGIALKDEMLMQIFADVIGKDIYVADTTQAGALGSAIYASVAAGIYGDIKSAAEKMSKPYARVYKASAENHRAYGRLFDEYKTLHDYFGRGGNDVMKRIMKK